MGIMEKILDYRYLKSELDDLDERVAKAQAKVDSLRSPDLSHMGSGGNLPTSSVESIVMEIMGLEGARTAIRKAAAMRKADLEAEASRLEGKERIAFEMHYIDGLTYARTAMAMGVSNRYAMYLVQSAVDKLR